MNGEPSKDDTLGLTGIIELEMTYTNDLQSMVYSFQYPANLLQQGWTWSDSLHFENDEDVSAEINIIK